MIILFFIFAIVVGLVGVGIAVRVFILFLTRVPVTETLRVDHQLRWGMVILCVFASAVQIAARAFRDWEYKSIWEGLVAGLLIFAVVAVMDFWTMLLFHFFVNMRLAGKYKDVTLSENIGQIRRRLRYMRWFHRMLFKLRRETPDEQCRFLLS